jgi:hypothetical protein
MQASGYPKRVSGRYDPQSLGTTRFHRTLRLQAAFQEQPTCTESKRDYQSYVTRQGHRHVNSEQTGIGKSKRYKVIFCAQLIKCHVMKTYREADVSICLSIYLSIYLWLYSQFVGSLPLFSFLILYTIGRTPWTEDLPVQGRYLHRIHAQTSMPRVGFEHTIPVFERAKAVHASDRAATVSGGIAPPFLLSTLNGSNWSPSRFCRFTSGERVPGAHWRGGRVGPRIGLSN